MLFYTGRNDTYRLYKVKQQTKLYGVKSWILYCSCSWSKIIWNNPDLGISEISCSCWYQDVNVRVFFFQAMHFTSFSVLTLILPSLSASFSFFYFYKFFDGSPLSDFSISCFVFFLSTSVNKPDRRLALRNFSDHSACFWLELILCIKNWEFYYFCKPALSFPVEVQALKLYWRLSDTQKSEDK